MSGTNPLTLTFICMSLSDPRAFHMFSLQVSIMFFGKKQQQHVFFH